MKKNVWVITGSRADFNLLEPIIKLLNSSNKLKSRLLVTGMHTLKSYGSTYLSIKDKGYKIDALINLNEDGDQLMWLSEEIKRIRDKFINKTVDCILILGDRDEAFASAIVANHLGIILAHIHGGDVTGEFTVDQKMRQCITRLSSIHFAATEKSAHRIINSQERKNVFIVGSPALDELRKYSFIPEKVLCEKLSLPKNKPRILVLLHPLALDKNYLIEKQIDVVYKSVLCFGKEVVWIYPNSDDGSTIFIEYLLRMNKNNNHLHIFQNLNRELFISLLKHCNLLVGNSSAGIIESTYYKIPVINIGNRQQDREQGENVINVDYCQDKITNAIKKASTSNFIKKCRNTKNIYGNGNASKKIVKILEKIL